MESADYRNRFALPKAPFIGGNYCSINANKYFETINPATKEILAEFPDCGGLVVNTAVRAARQCFEGKWRALAPQKRKSILLDFARDIQSAQEELSYLISTEMGKPVSMANDEVTLTAALTQYYAELADKIYGETAPSDPKDTLAMTFMEPCGVVGVISPWNFPIATAATAFAPALAAGNTVVLKPSELTPSSSLKLAEIATEAGLPDGALNVVVGTGVHTGAELANHTDVDKLHFTGSTTTGRKLLVYAGQSNGKPVMLETGGKSPHIVFDDSLDIENIGAGLAASTFANTGQICVARTRLLVHEKIKDAIMARIISETKSVFKIGDPLDPETTFGPIAGGDQLKKIDQFISNARDNGALQIDIPISGDYNDSGYYMPPLMLDRVSQEMPAVCEEIFGPVLSVQTFRTYDEAVKMANATRYGLAATVWTRNLEKARKAARDINAGRVDIRTSADGAGSFIELSAEPFKESGYGVLGGVKGIEPYLKRKAVQFITN